MKVTAKYGSRPIAKSINPRCPRCNGEMQRIARMQHERLINLISMGVFMHQRCYCYYCCREYAIHKI